MTGGYSPRGTATAAVLCRWKRLSVTGSGVLNPAAACFDDERRPRRHRGAGRHHIFDDAEVTSPLAWRHGAAEVAPMGVVEADEGVLTQKRRQRRRRVDAVATAGDRGADEFGGDDPKTEVMTGQVRGGEV
jgi:hypothetical protein